MFKRLIISLFAIVAISASALADEKNSIVTVNVDKVKMETKAGQSIAKQLGDIQNAFKDKVTKLQQDFDSQKVELEKQKAVLSKEAFAKKETAFNTKLNESRKAMQKEAGDLEQMQQNALNEFNNIALGVIADIAKENNYTQILPVEILIYADPKIDITSQVIAAIDKKSDNIVVKK